VEIHKGFAKTMIFVDFNPLCFGYSYKFEFMINRSNL